MSKPTENIIFEQRSKCPYCSRQIHTLYKRVTKTPAVKAQSELVFLIEKDMQTTLEADYQESLKATKKPGRPRKVTNERS
jgi:hypothetical protein